MKRLTDVDICIEKIKQLPVSYDAETVQRCIEILSNAPTIEAEPVRHGKWNRYYRMHSGDTFVCNRCGSCFVVLQGGDKMNSCPYCGARMDKE